MWCHFLLNTVTTSAVLFRTFNKFLNGQKYTYVHPKATKDIVNIFFEILVTTFTFRF